jgi:hypothetical protein
MAAKRPPCKCFASSRAGPLHLEAQDKDCQAWSRLLRLIERLERRGKTEVRGVLRTVRVLIPYGQRGREKRPARPLKGLARTPHYTPSVGTV